MKRYIIFGSIILLILIITAVIFIFNTKTINPNNIYINEVTVSDKSFIFKGDIMDAANNFKGYKVDFKDNILYLKIQGGIFPQSKSKGSINIFFENNYGNIKEVQLQAGDSAMNKIIWSVNK